MTTRGRAELALFATTFIWGSTFVVVKAGSGDISPSLFIALRFGIGALAFALFLLPQLRTIKRSTVLRSMILGAMLGTGILLQNNGIYLTTASKSAFITGLMVIFTPIAQLILERRPPKAGNIIGIIIVTVGLYLLTSPSGSELNTGDLLVLVSAAIFGVYIVYLDIFSKEENVLHLSFLQVSVTTLTALLVVPFETFVFEPTAQLIGSLLYMGICATVFTTYVQTRFQKDTTPTRAVIIFTIEPVIASVLAYFVLGEVLGLTGIIGAALIVAGILFSEFSDSITRFVSGDTVQEGR
ncbi:MAG: DMT family transporter [Bacteroidetes bacterium]|nr:DMT family transporter [Bacteroidota bacterium]